MSELESLKSKIFNREKEVTLIDKYHYFMIHYGYVPYEEFLKMDVLLVNELFEKLNEMNKDGGKK